ncbi:putative GTPase obg-like [Capsicum annuum]|nr:putative GTPase obg-like [Capsicum annuum]KAF3683656.1 putative GTPase obg-like [Capsicum annuum]
MFLNWATGSYLPSTYGPMHFPPEMVSMLDWIPCLASASLVASQSTQSAGGAGPVYGPMIVCNYLLQHLPTRDRGAPICCHYSQVGVCKFGPSCKFDHPLGISYSPSASSLTDMPVAPYPGGSSVGTLAPSSSSSDLRPELVSGSSKEVFSTQASSMRAASGPVGSMFSKGDSVSHSGVCHSYTSSSCSRSTGHDGSYLLGSYGPMLFSPEMVPMSDWTPCPVRILTKRKTRSTEMDNGIYVKIHIYIPQISCSSGVWAARVYLEMQIPSGCCLKHQEKHLTIHWEKVTVPRHLLLVICPLLLTLLVLWLHLPLPQTLDELVSGSSKEVFSTLVSSMSTANGPVGSMFSKGDPVSHSGVQQSCTSSSVSRSTGHLG